MDVLLLMFSQGHLKQTAMLCMEGGKLVKDLWWTTESDIPFV